MKNGGEEGRGLDGLEVWKGVIMKFFWVTWVFMDFLCLHEWTSAITERKKHPFVFFVGGRKNFGISRILDVIWNHGIFSIAGKSTSLHNWVTRKTLPSDSWVWEFHSFPTQRSKAFWTMKKSPWKGGKVGLSEHMGWYLDWFKCFICPHVWSF